MQVAQGCSSYFGGPPPDEEGCLEALAVYLSSCLMLSS
jgi:hypothetical protein